MVHSDNATEPYDAFPHVPPIRGWRFPATPPKRGSVISKRVVEKVWPEFFVRIVLLLANSLLGWCENTRASDAMQKLNDVLTLGGAGGAAVLGGHAL